MKLFKPFPKKISTPKLFLYWFCFFIVGISLMIFTSILFPSFVEIEEADINFCNFLNLMYVISAPVLETVIFMIIPFYIFKKNKIVLAIGIIIWILLHLLTRNIPTFSYITIIGYFYFRCLEIQRWKFVIFAHFIVNIFGIWSCFFWFLFLPINQE